MAAGGRDERAGAYIRPQAGAEKEESMNTTILIKVLLVITLVGIIGAIVGGDR